MSFWAVAMRRSKRRRLVSAAGANVTVISAALSDGIRRELAETAQLIERTPKQSDLNGAVLVFIALPDAVQSAHWARVTRQHGVLVNVVDQPAECDFTTPSIIDRGPFDRRHFYRWRRAGVWARLAVEN